MAILIPSMGACVARMTGGERRVAERLEAKLELPVVAPPGARHIPARGEGEQEAAQVFARVFYVTATRATQRLVMGVGNRATLFVAILLSRHSKWRNTGNPLPTYRFQNDEAVTLATVSARLPPTVAAPDQAHFTQLVLQEFAALHPGNVVRFGIRPLVFAAWKERHGGA